jgi:hypothetical protein
VEVPLQLTNSIAGRIAVAATSARVILIIEGSSTRHALRLSETQSLKGMYRSASVLAPEPARESNLVLVVSSNPRLGGALARQDSPTWRSAAELL